ncbi:deoxyribonuclease-1 [Biomphalaria pfeifferi]|uniref:Deoxyribonuclease n=1 Tax=Biomphalaria pfeifferi TaxID=112525 RepID=A0AAD8BX26_BIOPF|nr:deoxyribonuclease-1 [Biomphalaria pfeifferi]
MAPFVLSAVFFMFLEYAYGINVAAFNIQHFGDTKVNDVGRDIVRVLANYDIVLIQEVRDMDQSSLNTLKDLLGSKVWDYVSSDPIGRGTYKEQYVYFYKKAVVKILGQFQYDDSARDVFEREPFAVNIQYNSPKRGKNVNVVLMGIHTKPEKAFVELEALPTAMTAAKSYFSKVAGVIAMGDFNADCNYVNDAQKASLAIFNQNARYRSLIPDTADTTTSTSTNCAYDRIVVEGNSDIVVDSARVYRFDTDLGIAFDRTAAISDHYPVDFKLQ